MTALPLSTNSPSKRRRPPGPRASYPGQFVRDLAVDMPSLFKKMKKEGDITQVYVGPQAVVLLNHPDDVQRVLVTDQKNFTKGRALDRVKKTLLGNGLLTSEGEFHLRQRRLAQPAFHRQRILGYSHVMAAYTERAASQWQDGATLDIHEEMMHLTLAIAAKTLFDADIDTEATVVAEAMELSLRIFKYGVLPGGWMIEYLPIPWIRRTHRARARMNDLIVRVIEDRRRSGEDRGDLLSMLMAAQDTEGDGGGMTDKQLRDEVVTILMAGHETTAVAMSWTWYLLSQNPEIEAKLHAELTSVLGGRTPTAEDMPKLPYTRAVIAESMRLYPPAWILERRAINDFQIGDFKIKAGALVLMSQMLIHRDPRWWPEPDAFVPDRWLDAEATAARPKFAYFPFGAGTRICIGEQFAWMEAVLCLATIAQRWTMRHDPTHVVDGDALVTLRPRYGMRMTLQRR